MSGSMADARNSFHADGWEEYIAHHQPSPELCKAWVPLCASGNGPNDTSSDDEGTVGEQDEFSRRVSMESFLRSASMESEEVSSTVDSIVDDNIFRRGTAWLWRRRMSKLDDDVAVWLAELSR